MCIMDSIKTVQFLSGNSKNAPYIKIHYNSKEKHWDFEGGGIVTDGISEKVVDGMRSISKYWLYSSRVPEVKRVYSSIQMMLNLSKRKKRCSVIVDFRKEFNNEASRDAFDKQFNL